MVGYVWEQKLVTYIYEGTLPLKSALVTSAFSEEGNDLTDVSMTMAFKPKFGSLGALMVPMMTPKLRAMMQGLLDGNAAYVERGDLVARAAQQSIARRIQDADFRTEPGRSDIGHGHDP